MDSLRKSLSNSLLDSDKIKVLNKLSGVYYRVNPDSSLYFLQQGMAIAARNQFTKTEAELFGSLGLVYSRYYHRPDTAVELIGKGIDICHKYSLFETQTELLRYQSGVYYYGLKKSDTAIFLLQQGLQIARKYKLTGKEIELLITLGTEYVELQNVATGLQCMHQAFVLCGQHKLSDEQQLLLDLLERQILNANYTIALPLTQWGVTLAKNLKNRILERDFLEKQADIYKATSNYPKALEILLQVFEMNSNLDDQDRIISNLQNIAGIYEEERDYNHALDYLFKAGQYLQRVQDDEKLMLNYEKIGYNYEQLNKRDSANFYARKAFDLATQIDPEYIPGIVLSELGRIYANMGQDSMAMDCFRKSIPSLVEDQKSRRSLCESYFGMAKLLVSAGKTDSGLYYARLCFDLAKLTRYLRMEYNSSSLLAELYSSKKIIDSAFAYQKISYKTQDLIFGQEQTRQMENVTFNEQARAQELRDAEERYNSRIQFYALVGGLILMLLIAGILYQNNKQQQKSYTLLKRQNQLIDFQKIKVEETLQELKSTQAQLIQSEKMASLGQLTAGIAHEIQNPLNFVKNFSELNIDLIREMNEELKLGNVDEGRAIASDVDQNMVKILQHGNRADAIVKSMLQHSRIGAGKKEMIVINEAIKEQLNLAYQAYFSKNKSLKLNIQTDFDGKLDKTELVPQHMNQALQNIFNNAFYALEEKAKVSDEKFNPAVTVTTRYQSVNKGMAEIRIRDNGMGITASNIEKIFQPFFTTKPAGQGTGLGLSLCYDIIQKEHGGQLRVESAENVYTEFMISLPLKISHESV